MDRIDQVLSELKSVNKSVTAIEKLHAVLVATNDEQQKNFDTKMGDLVEQKRIQNGRVKAAEDDIKENAVCIARMKGSTRAWSISISTVIAVSGIILGALKL